MAKIKHIAKYYKYLVYIVLLSALGGFSYTSFLIITSDVYDEKNYTDRVTVENTSFASGALKLSSRIYRPKKIQENQKLPAVVMLHGTNKAGMDLLLYPLMARELADRGFIVFTYNQRGYASSPDPPKDKDGNYILDFVGDAVRAVKYLSNYPEVDKERITLMGHSFGGSVAVGVSHVKNIETLFEKIMIISPGTGWPYKGEQRYIFRAKRLSKDMKLDPVIRLNNIKILYKTLDLDTMLDRKTAIPIVYVNGDYEERLKPLLPYYKKTPPPVHLVLIDNTGHYFGTKNIINRLNLPIQIYKQEILKELLGKVFKENKKSLFSQ